jgi:hypothetical protein
MIAASAVGRFFQASRRAHGAVHNLKAERSAMRGEAKQRHGFGFPACE